MFYNLYNSTVQNKDQFFNRDSQLSHNLDNYSLIKTKVEWLFKFNSPYFSPVKQSPSPAYFLPLLSSNSSLTSSLSPPLSANQSMFE